jgi:hypothetical protein
LNATPSTKNDSVTDPPLTYFIPTKSLSNKLGSNLSTAETTISAKCSLYVFNNLEFKEVYAHLISISLLSFELLLSIEI